MNEKELNEFLKTQIKFQETVAVNIKHLTELLITQNTLIHQLRNRIEYLELWKESQASTK